MLGVCINPELLFLVKILDSIVLTWIRLYKLYKAYVLFAIQIDLTADDLTSPHSWCCSNTHPFCCYLKTWSLYSLLFATTASNLTKLQQIQNFALRTVLNLHPRSHISNHFQELHWLTVQQRIHFKLLSITFKCIHCLAPSLLSSKIRLSSPFDMTLDSTFHPLSNFGKKAFSYSAPRCWNALPRDVRIIPTFDTFKAQLKHHLFTNFNSYLHAVDPYT